MYSRGFGNLKQPDYEEQQGYPDRSDYADYAEAEESRPPAVECGGKPSRRSGGNGIRGLLSGINTEDLLLIAIAALLLLDGDPDNDILILALALILFF